MRHVSPFLHIYFYLTVPMLMTLEPPTAIIQKIQPY